MQRQIQEAQQQAEAELLAKQAALEENLKAAINEASRKENEERLMQEKKEFEEKLRQTREEMNAKLKQQEEVAAALQAKQERASRLRSMLEDQLVDTIMKVNEANMMCREMVTGVQLDARLREERHDSADVDDDESKSEDGKLDDEAEGDDESTDSMSLVRGAACCLVFSATACWLRVSVCRASRTKFGKALKFSSASRISTSRSRRCFGAAKHSFLACTSCGPCTKALSKVRSCTICGCAVQGASPSPTGVYRRPRAVGISVLHRRQQPVLRAAAGSTAWPRHCVPGNAQVLLSHRRVHSHCGFLGAGVSAFFVFIGGTVVW